MQPSPKKPTEQNHVYSNQHRVAVIFHSGYGHTAKQACAVARGVTSLQGVESLLIAVEDIGIS